MLLLLFIVANSPPAKSDAACDANPVDEVSYDMASAVPRLAPFPGCSFPEVWTGQNPFSTVTLAKGHVQCRMAAMAGQAVDYYKFIYFNCCDISQGV